MELTYFHRFERPAFLAGIVLRLLLIFLVVPITYSEWFIPFLTFASSGNPFLYWTEFLSVGGSSNAFPYGPIYLLVFKPLTSLGHLIGGAYGASVGLGVTVLILDICLFKVLRSLLPAERQFWIVYLYWLLPNTLYVNYWHGQLDVLPVLLLFLAFRFIYQNRFFPAALALGAAISAKFVMVMALPFFLVFLFQDRRLRPQILHFIMGIVFPIIFIIPFAITSGFQKMVFGTPESQKLFALKYNYAEGLNVYIVPAVIILLVYLAWRLKRYSNSALIFLTGASFFLLVLLTPSSPGWILWLAPFIALHGALWTKRSILILGVFTFAAVLFHFSHASGVNHIFGEGSFALRLDNYAPYSSLLVSIVVLAGLILLFQMWRLNITGTAFHRVTRNPILISIAGDSGTGKDTLSDSIIGLLGVPVTVGISGDDYHNWDRKKPMWRAVTHLDPLANDLRKFESDVLALTAGQPIKARHYDHITGKMTKPAVFGARDFVISSGLHALYLPKLVALSDLAVFLDMDETLRRELKISRDVSKRGHSREAAEAAIEKRAADSVQYIQPQKNEAHLILRLFRDRSHIVIESTFELGTNTAHLERYLVSLGRLDVRATMMETHRMKLTVFGHPPAEVISAIARKVSPNILELLQINPKWESGALGLSQLFVLFELEQKLFAGSTKYAV
jgi:uridine kinase